MLYRMPLDGSSPSAVGVWGSPVDQFSFLESDDGHVNVLVRSEAGGEAMWRPELSSGDVAGKTPWWRYHRLPAPGGYTFHNRFVGHHLLYGVGSGWGRPKEGSATL